MSDRRLDVRCDPAGDGWTCQVVVGTDAAATRHEVRVRRADLDRMAMGATAPETLVEAAFGFLLEREPRESILRRFDIAVIERYFPGADEEIRLRLGAA